MSLFDLQTSDEPYGFRAALSGEIDLSTVEDVESELRTAIDGVTRAPWRSTCAR